MPRSAILAIVVTIVAGGIAATYSRRLLWPMVMMCASLLVLIEWHAWFGDATWPVARVSWTLMAVVSGVAFLREANSERLRTKDLEEKKQKHQNLRVDGLSVNHPFERQVVTRLDREKPSDRKLKLVAMKDVHSARTQAATPAPEVFNGHG
jgi:hypothetical protein